MIHTFSETSPPVEFLDDEHPSRAWKWKHETRSLHRIGSTFYGYAFLPCSIDCGSGHFEVKPGHFFAVPDWIRITGGMGVLIERVGFRGMFQLGGPIEDRGRLAYIDGCNDTLLIGPLVKGDPCLNHLHFPAGIRQTSHTHPTVRIGIVAKGRGICVTPEETYDLTPGLCWCLPVGGEHCFFTDAETMDIIAWHPDSDTGPWRDDHPMVNRTYVGGQSAVGIEEIRTQGPLVH